jgi:hypothetical protein
MSFIASRVHDGVIQEPSPWSRVATVFPDMPPIRSYVEAAADYYVVKPTSSFVIAPADEFVRWNTSWGAAPSSCPLRSTMGPLASLYGFEGKTTWSPSCWDLNCPQPGEPAGSVAEPFAPARTAFVPYNPRLSSSERTGRCMSGCAALCSGPGDTTKCATACASDCLRPSGIELAPSYMGYRSDRDCAAYCADSCSGRPNFNGCVAGCSADCRGANVRKADAWIPTSEACRDACASECATSSDVNDCFLPCSANCH